MESHKDGFFSSTYQLIIGTWGKKCLQKAPTQSDLVLSCVAQQKEKNIAYYSIKELAKDERRKFLAMKQ